MDLPPFSVAEVVTRWQFAPVVTAFAVVAAGLYLWGVLRVRRRHRDVPVCVTWTVPCAMALLCPPPRRTRVG